MLSRDPLPFLLIASKQNGYRAQIRAGEPTDPTIGMIGAGITENLPTRCHALTEFFGKASERHFVDAERAQTKPGKRHGDPAPLIVDPITHRLGRRYLVDDAG